MRQENETEARASTKAAFAAAETGLGPLGVQGWKTPPRTPHSPPRELEHRLPHPEDVLLRWTGPWRWRMLETFVLGVRNGDEEYEEDHAQDSYEEVIFLRATLCGEDLFG